MDRVLFTRRWVVRHVLILGAVTVCLAAGSWQLHRLSERRERNARIAAQAALAPLALSAAPGAADALRRATAVGTYDAAREVKLAGRTLQGLPGEHALTPLVLGDGTAVLVDRGWIPAVSSSSGAPAAARVRVSGVLLPSERPRPLTPRQQAAGRVYRIDTTAIGGRLPYRLAPVYLLLASQDPPQPGGVPAPAPPPSLAAGDGPHLSYAIQWFTFAAIALGGHLVLVRRATRR